MLARAVRIHERGGPEVMRLDQIEIPDPGRGEVRIRQTAIGLNFNEPGHRDGTRLEARYETPLPMILGTEAAGIVDAVGRGVTRFREGDRVACWYSPPAGSYTDVRNYPVERLVGLPEGVGEETAAAYLLKAMTVDMLVNRAYRIRRGDTVLVHAAAGATGLILTQWARHLGATVIGTMSTDAKAEVARSYGCDYTINYARDDFVGAVREITGGRGVMCVYDGVGVDTLQGSLDCLRFRGTCVLYGISSGRPDCFDTTELSKAGSLYLTRPSVHQHNPTPAAFHRSAKRSLDMLTSGAIRVHIGQKYRLEEVAQAHRDLVGRRTTGSSVLLP
jgi:NADPH2:quinone reductase